MGPGRLLDSLVEHFVFKHETRKINGQWYWVGPIDTLPGTPFVFQQLSLEGHIILSYSHDKVAAWDRLAMRYIGAGCAAWWEGDGHTGDRAGITSQAGRFESDGENVAHAMCLAVLAACGVRMTWDPFEEEVI